MKLSAKLESLLFVASRPLSYKKLADLAGASWDDVKAAVEELKQSYNTEDRGIQLAVQGSSIQFVTSPLAAKLVADFLKAERSGELTKPALETLTIIAYRGPIAKSEIDLIRGVNCSLILRNLMIRGLISSHEDKDKMATMYEISFDFLRHLGLRDISELPDYQTLNSDTRLEEYLRPKPAASPEAGSADAPQAADGSENGTELGEAGSADESDAEQKHDHEGEDDDEG